MTGDTEPDPADWWMDDEQRALATLREIYELLDAIVERASPQTLHFLRALYAAGGCPEFERLVAKIDERLQHLGDGQSNDGA